MVSLYHPDSLNAKKKKKRGNPSFPTWRGKVSVIKGST